MSLNPNKNSLPTPERDTKYWIGVVSLNHVQKGVEEGFGQLCHGKERPLKRMQKGDWIIYYSPKKSLDSNEPVRAFTAIGRVKDERIYEFQMAENFIPFRRDIDFYKDAKAVPIKRILDYLEFVEDKSKYGYKFRFGHFEISKKDFLLIAHEMGLPLKYG